MCEIREGKIEEDEEEATELGLLQGGGELEGEEGAITS